MPLKLRANQRFVAIKLETQVPGFLRRARAIPATMAAGPVSPPMASMAMRGLASTAGTPLSPAQASVEVISRPL